MRAIINNKNLLRAFGGASSGCETVFTEQLSSTDLQPVGEATALQSANARRWDLRSAEAQMRATEQTIAAALSERLPSISFNGHYGAMGPRSDQSHGVFVASGTLGIPVFDGGKISADVQQARATLRQR